MPRLARLRFVNVGHPRSRMRDLVLDLRDSEGHPTDSTLWLRNGGGKSSILNLFFALVRPGRHDFLGGKADARQRRLEDYVLPDDRAVIVAEWELDPEGSLLAQGPPGRFLTGVFYEYRSGAAAADENRLKRLFFCGHVAQDEPALTLEGLPLFQPGADGTTRRATLAGFRQRWREISDVRGYLGVQQTEIVQDWRLILEGVGIDPELFKYQIQMNAREGGADEVFRFGDGEQFVDFLIKLVMDAALGDQVGKNITTWREELRDRVEKLVPEREMTVGLGLRLGPLEALAEERGVLARACARERGRLAACEAWLAAETAAERTRMLATAEAATAARGEVERAEHHRDSAARRGAGLRRFAARLQGEAADRERKKLDEAYKSADRERAIWQAAVPLKEALGHEVDGQRRRQELARRTADAEPLRRELVNVAGQYAAATTRMLTEAQQKEIDAGEGVNEAVGRSKRSEGHAKHAYGRVVGSRAEGEGAAKELARIAQLAARMEREGLLSHGEPPVDAIRRLEEAHASALAEIERQDRLLATQKRERAALDDLLAKAQLRLLGAAGVLKAEQEGLTRADAARRDFEANSRLQRVLEVDSLDLDRLPDAVLDQVAVAARRHADAAVDLRAARAEDERALAGLDSNGLLPPTREVEYVLNALGGLKAWSGWAWLEANVQGERRAAVVRDAPAHVLGVVVRDADFEDARTRLMNGALRLDLPVTVVPAASFGHEALTGGFVVGPTTAALFDKSAAVQERGQRAERIERSGTDEETHRKERTAFDQLRAELARFRLDHPQGWFAARLKQIRWQIDEVAGAERSLAALKIEVAAIEAQRAEAERKRDGMEKAERGVADQLGRVRAFMDDHHARIAGLQAQRLAAAAELALAQEAERLATAEAEGAGRDAAAAQEEATKWHSEVRALREARSRINYAENEIDPGQSTLEALAGLYEDLRAQYEGRLNQEQLLVLAEESDRNAQVARKRLGTCLSTTVKEPDVRAALNALPPGDDVDLRYRTSLESWSAAQGRLGQSGHSINQAATALGEAQAACARLGEVAEPEPSPASIEAALDAAAKFEIEAEGAQRAADHWGAEALTNDAVVARGDARIRGLEKDFHRLESLRETYVELLAEEPSLELGPHSDEEAAETLETSDRALRAARIGRLALDGQRAGAVQQVREWIDEPRFEALRHPMARQFGRLADVELEARAVELQAQLAVRVRALDAQVAGVNRHRDLLLTELAIVADEGLVVLRSAENWSRLPDSLPGFAGRSFLRIHHSAPEDPAERQARLGELLDQMAREEKDIPTGTQLIQRVVRKLIHPVRVKVLFPDAASSEPPMDIAEVAKFSGGEQLTCAILLYCTLAQMRARRSGRRRRSSVLVLDNPIGRASRTRFLELQREVARAMDVQLLYTTGINDHEALHALPNRIRLRNDRSDRTRGHQVIEHEEGEIVAVSFQRREARRPHDREGQ